jgi:ABC-type Fe3+ transport system substrate-binding protein
MFRVGQQVVCVNDKPEPNRNLPLGLIFPKKGTTYIIRAIYIAHNSDTGLLLEEIVNPFVTRDGQEIGFSSSRFRSLVEDGMIEELLSRIIDEVKEEILEEELAGITD